MNILQTYKQAFSGLPQSAWMLSLAVLVNRSGSMVLFFMTLYLTTKMDYSATDAGLIVTIYGLGAMAGSYLGGWLSDLWGVNKVQVSSLFFSGIALIILGYLDHYYAIAITMFLLALIAEAFRPANATAIAHVCPPEKRARCYGLNRMAINVGVTIGPAIGGFLAGYDYHLIFWVDGLTCIASAVILEYLYRSKKIVLSGDDEEGREEESASPYRDGHFLWFLLMLFFMGIVFAQVFSTWPLYLKQQNLFNEQMVGFLLALNAIFVSIIEMPLIHRFEKVDPLKVIIIGAIFFYTGFSILPAYAAFWFAALSVITWSIGEVLIFPLATGFVANRSDKRSMGKYMGLFNLNFAISLVIGPIAGSWIYEHQGPGRLWLYIGLLGLFIVAGLIMLQRRLFAESKNKRI